jgi:hypothetical protein
MRLTKDHATITCREKKCKQWRHVEKTVDFVMNLCPKHRRTIFTETFKVFAQLIFSPFEQVIVQPFSLVDNDVMQMAELHKSARGRYAGITKF